MKTILSIGILLMAGMAAQADWAVWNVNTAIPDNESMGLQDTQTLSGFADVIESLEVRLTLSGDPLAFNGDFYVSLLSANGGYAVLLNRVGRTSADSLGYDHNGFDITFTLTDDDVHLYSTFSPSPSYDGQGRLIGMWGADARAVDPDDVSDTVARTANLDSFAGIDPNGDWTIFVADMNLNGTATLDSWGLNVTIVPEPGTAVLMALGVAFLGAARRRFF